MTCKWFWWLISASAVVVAFSAGDDSDVPWKRNKVIYGSVVFHRHGDRAAQRTAPAYAAGDRQSYNVKFPIDDQEWPVDYGQLSGLGALQCRNFGSYLRDRYVGKDKLLDEKYNHYETHVRSTDVDRTLVSSMAVMAGLYPGRSIAPGFDGTVLVPIHTVPYATDALMDGSASKHCPRFNRAATAALNSKTIRNAILSDRKFASSLAILANVTGDRMRAMPGTSLVSLVTSLRDLRLCQRAHNMTQPKNVTQWDSKLEDLTTRITNAKWGSAHMGALVGGRALRAVANRFKATVAVYHHEQWALEKMNEECNAKGSDSDEDGGCPRKLAVYTGHDTTIFDLRAALGVDITEPGVVPYVSHLIFELEGDGKNFTVSLLSGSFLKKATPLAGPFCGGKSTCSLDKFLAYVERTVPMDIDKACSVTIEQLSNGQPGSTETTTSSFVPQLLKTGFITVAAIVVGAVGALLISARLRRSRYNRID
ncbi:hypothetical protein NDN08_002883 [Rhodosorus marinus]|uniref:Acid phosphatase n=1 Tax=Rhodosorus marinus TaxID=101924 RepID=A0AAV8UV02_9RHOD|nr:hypothetical protein NDN08_002883 [Rhodosorus marinus]